MALFRLSYLIYSLGNCTMILHWGKSDNKHAHLCCLSRYMHASPFFLLHCFTICQDSSRFGGMLQAQEGKALIRRPWLMEQPVAQALLTRTWSGIPGEDIREEPFLSQICCLHFSTSLHVHRTINLLYEFVAVLENMFAPMSLVHFKVSVTCLRHAIYMINRVVVLHFASTPLPWLPSCKVTN